MDLILYESNDLDGLKKHHFTFISIIGGLHSHKTMFYPKTKPIFRISSFLHSEFFMTINNSSPTILITVMQYNFIFKTITQILVFKQM